MKKPWEYFSLFSAAVDSEIFKYKKDYKNPGDFEYGSGESRCGFNYLKWMRFPGIFDGRCWKAQEASSDDSYAIHIYYFNKKTVYIEILADYGSDSHLIPTFEFVKKQAIKHHLKNTNSDDNPQQWNFQEQIDFHEKLFNQRRAETADHRIGNSWEKIMTLPQAKNLFHDLKLQVRWPEGLSINLLLRYVLGIWGHFLFKKKLSKSLNHNLLLEM